MPTKSRALFAFTCLFCLLLAQQTFSLSCGECRTELCEKKQCDYGSIKDSCRCCIICAKGPGEECGGLWGLGGTCAHGLVCTFGKIPEGYHYYYFRTGICLKASY